MIVAEQSWSILCYQPLLSPWSLGPELGAEKAWSRFFWQAAVWGATPGMEHLLCSPGPGALPGSGPALSKCCLESGVGVWALTLPFRGGRDPLCPFVHRVLLWKPRGEEETVLSPTWDRRGRCCWNAHFSLPPVLVTVLLLLLLVFKK